MVTVCNVYGVYTFGGQIFLCHEKCHALFIPRNGSSLQKESRSLCDSKNGKEKTCNIDLGPIVDY